MSKACRKSCYGTYGAGPIFVSDQQHKMCRGQGDNNSIRGQGDNPALLPGSLLLASGVAIYGLVTQVIMSRTDWGVELLQILQYNS